MSHSTADDFTPGDVLSAAMLSNICIRGWNGEIFYWSSGAERLYEWTTEEAIGKITHTLLRTQFPSPLSDIETVLKHQGTWNGQLLHRTKSGREVWVASHWSLQRNPDGSPRCVVEVSNDVTEFKEVEARATFLAGIVASSDDAIISKNLDGMITSWNVGAETLFGYTKAEMLGGSVLRLFPPELVTEEASILSRIGRGERIQSYETIRVSKSGRRIPISLTISPLFDDRGDVVGASKIARDISERKALEEAVVASEEQQRLAADAGEVGLWMYTVPTRTLQWSDRCRQFFDVGTNEATPGFEEIASRLHPDDRASVMKALKRSMKAGAPFEVDFRLINRNGQCRWIHSKGLARKQDGVVTDLLGAVTDFTARKQIEEDLIRSNGELAQFAHVTAHDLQEPLRNTALLLELIRVQAGARLDRESEKLMMRAVANAHRSESMVRDLLAYAKLLHEFTELRDEVSEANAVLAEAVHSVSSAIAENSAEVKSSHLPRVRMAKKHLKSIFVNLLDNSLKHRGPDPPRIQVGAEEVDGCTQIFVSDNGLGIEPEFQDRVFEVFKRLRKRETSGSGMGLPFCRRLVERYGGRIWIRSTGLQGTTVVFTVLTYD